MLRIRQWFCANFNLHNILNNLLFSGNAAKNIQFRCARLVSFIHWATLMRFRKHEQLVSMRQTEMGWLDSVDKRETNYKKDNEYSLLYISIKAALVARLRIPIKFKSFKIMFHIFIFDILLFLHLYSFNYILILLMYYLLFKKYYSYIKPLIPRHF